MSFFDLLFLGSVLLTIAALIAAAISAMRGRGRGSASILKFWGIYAALYMTVALAFDFFKPHRTIGVGDPWCFDDWCLSVEGDQSVPAQSGTTHTITLRLFSRARRVAQRASDAWIYLIDGEGHLYPPDNDSTAVPLDVRLQPGQAVTTSRVFHVASQVKGLGLITGHGGPYCGAMSILIIGEGGCLFNKPTMIRIPTAGQP